MTLSELYEAISIALDEGMVTDPSVTVERDGEKVVVESLRWEDGALVLTLG